MDRKIVPVKGIDSDEGDYPLKDIFDQRFSAIYGFAPPNSGKSTLIYNLLDWATKDPTYAKNLIVILYNGTGKFEQTGITRNMVEMLTKRGVDVREYADLLEPIPSPTPANPFRVVYKDNLTPEIDQARADAEERKARELRDKAKPKRKPKPAPPSPDAIILPNTLPLLQSQVNPEPTPSKEKPLKERILIIDDLPTQLRMNALNDLVFKSRHYYTRTMIFTQDYRQTDPVLRRNVGYIIFFKNIARDVVQQLLRDVNIPNVDRDYLLRLYEQNTIEPHSFLMYSRKSTKMQKGLDPTDILQAQGGSALEPPAQALLPSPPKPEPPPATYSRTSEHARIRPNQPVRVGLRQPPPIQKPARTGREGMIKTLKSVLAPTTTV